MSGVSTMNSINTRVLRDCCGRFATGVTVVTTSTPEGTHGMTVSAFMSVSLDPPLIAISVNHQARMLDKIRRAGRYAVNILSHEMQSHALHFAGQREEHLGDIFEDRHNLPTLRGAVAVLVADVVREVEAGDHFLLLGHVRHLENNPAAEPLLYHAGQFGSLATQPAA